MSVLLLSLSVHKPSFWWLHVCDSKQQDSSDCWSLHGDVLIMQFWHNYASRRSRTRNTVKVTVWSSHLSCHKYRGMAFQYGIPKRTKLYNLHMLIVNLTKQLACNNCQLYTIATHKYRLSTHQKNGHVIIVKNMSLCHFVKFNYAYRNVMPKVKVQVQIIHHHKGTIR